MDANEDGDAFGNIYARDLLSPGLDMCERLRTCPRNVRATPIPFRSRIGVARIFQEQVKGHVGRCAWKLRSVIGEAVLYRRRISLVDEELLLVKACWVHE